MNHFINSLRKNRGPSHQSSRERKAQRKEKAEKPNQNKPQHGNEREQQAAAASLEDSQAGVTKIPGNLQLLHPLRFDSHKEQNITYTTDADYLGQLRSFSGATKAAMYVS
jgi:hypothetical protein